MRYDIELPWADFKMNVLESGHYSWVHFETDDTLMIFAKQNDFTVLCKIPASDTVDIADFEDNYMPVSGQLLKSKVTTEFERTDLTLKLCSVEATFASGEAEISIVVPGTPGSGDGRYVAGGFALTDVFAFGDRCTKVQVVDVDNLLGMGAHTVVQTYHDPDVDAANQGWFMWPMPVAGGEVEIDPMGYYGFIPSGLYLEIYFEAASATKVYCDIWWGKQD